MSECNDSLQKTAHTWLLTEYIWFCNITVIVFLKIDLGGFIL